MNLGGQEHNSKAIGLLLYSYAKKKISHMFWLHINPYQSCPSWFFIPTNTTFLRSISEVAIPKDNIREGIFAITLADMFHWFNGEEGKDMSHQ